MATIPVVVKHGGKKYDLELDTSLPGEVFKMQIYSVTGVEPERQKVLIKGGQLKDDTDISKLGIKPGHAFMMMGTPLGAGLAKAPASIKFLEDMSEKDLAQVKGAIPSGLHNLGNTCYMNSTLQALRSVPELHQELAKYQSNASSSSAGPSNIMSLIRGSGSDLTGNLRDLFKQMGETTEGFRPLSFVHALRTAFPQFDQKDRTGNYAQQDAEECYSQILTALRQTLATAEESKNEKFVDTYFSGKMKTTLTCDEDPEEKPQEGEDTFIKLNCHITVTVNHLKDGILAGLTEKIEKRSDKLERDAIYTKTSKVSRLPKYLTCHLLRFFWKRDINKKAKIMRKVTFPFHLDATDFCTEELKEKIIPVRDKLRELRRNEEDRIKQRRKARTVFIEPAAEEENKGDDKMDIDKDKATEAPVATKVPEEEEDWDMALAPLLDDEISADIGANHSALYELQAIISHQGASADSGHYCSYVRKTDDEEEEEEEGKGKGKGKRKAPAGGLAGGGGAESSSWWFFNDEKVTEVGWDRIETLAGGGEAHSALILLYKAVDMTPRLKKAVKP
ncbi:deubiquitinating enzyme [Orbilia brochopaga]|uniref:Ubiquitin carboxyl-terminal hydrolase n=1 Tax=Orbilia brochopaga TaxID=3140254 RepID=A0AAV9UWQ8_9PEZI